MSNSTTASPSVSDREYHEFIIMGCGPAGLQTAYCFRNDDAVVLERTDNPCGIFDKLPRARKLLSFNRVHSPFDERIPEPYDLHGFPIAQKGEKPPSHSSYLDTPQLKLDWNSLLSEEMKPVMTEYSDVLYPGTDVFCEYLKDYAKMHNINPHYHTSVKCISKDADGMFVLKTSQGKDNPVAKEYACKALIVATGLSSPYIPKIPGIEHAIGYEDMSWDPADYKGKRVLVIGKGNSAFEIAERILDGASLIHLASPTAITFAWDSKFGGHVRTNNARFIDTYQLKALNSMLDCTFDKIVKRDDGKYVAHIKYVRAKNDPTSHWYDVVIRATGFFFDTTIFDDSCKPATAIEDKFPAMNADWSSTNVENLYFAGTLTQTIDFKKASSAFVDGFRYNSYVLYTMLMRKFHGKPLPQQLLQSATPESLTEVAFHRFNFSSGLYAQYSFLGDAFVFDLDANAVRHYPMLGVQYMEETFKDEEFYCIITLEFGDQKYEDWFCIDRPSHSELDCNIPSAFLHPVLRCYNKGELTGTYHVLEELLAFWGEEHKPYFTNFLRKEYQRVLPRKEAN